LRNPKISILLIVKNALPLVVGTLDSLKTQSYKNFDVIAADGASTDGTVEALRKAASELPLRIISESDRSLADGLGKAFHHASGEVVGILSADERYYPHTLEKVVKWFDAEPDGIVCTGRVDFIDEQDKIVDGILMPPFEVSAHLACEVVQPILVSFFNRRLIGEDFRYDASVPTCPDYEFWARLGFRFPASAFRRHDVSIAQAYRTRDSMSFRAESFTQFCRDKLSHLNNLLAKGYVRTNAEALQRRASAGVHMWAAEQLNSIEPGHPDILAHCAEAARYDPAYERIGRCVAATGKARYDAATGTVTRTVADRPGLQAVAVAVLDCTPPPPHWVGAGILAREPLTLQTADTPWGFGVELAVADQNSVRRANGEQFWVRVDLQVVEGCVGVSMVRSEQDLVGELIFRQRDGRSLAFIPVPADLDPATPVMLRSGGQSSSVLRIYRAELLRDCERASAKINPIVLDH
jgi:glycosyltransferase involved in cell wall biosynthesis